MAVLPDIWSALTDLVYPRVCPACDSALGYHETDICLQCRHTLPYTDYHTFADNPVARHFWGKVPIEAATALYHFSKEGKVQHMLHHLKYKNRQDIGVLLGRFLAETLAGHPIFGTADVLIPVPLHPRKLARRGYNQSSVIGRGYAEVSGIQMEESWMKRQVNTATQTRKGRWERWQNVETSFVLADNISPAGKHILLLDDVITTGSTLEACASLLTRIPGVRVSLVAIAHAEM